MTDGRGDDLQALFGSQTRVRLLGALADSREPQTGYFLAKKAGVYPSKAYGELRRLEKAGILGARQNASGYKKYFLADDDLRKFLRRRVRITSAQEWFSFERTRERRRMYERLTRSPVELPEFTPEPQTVRNREEFERVPEKEEAIRRIQASQRSGSRS